MTHRKRVAFHLFPEVFFDGDSLTLGVGSTGGEAYPVQATRVLRRVVRSHNLGVSGATIQGLRNAAPARLDPHLDPRLRQVVVIWEARNALAAGFPEASVYADTVGYCQDRRQLGFKVIVCTGTPSSIGTEPSTFEADRQTLNASIRSNWPTFADGMADLGADALVGVAGAEANTTYFVDRLHMTSAGYGIVAGLVASAVNLIL